MPFQDGTGPRGIGPLTGRGFGPCGCNFGRSFGRFRSFEPVILNKEEQKKILESELKELELEKQDIEKRLKELK